MKELLRQAIDQGQKALSEYDAKMVLKESGIPVTREVLATSEEEAVAAARDLGFPLVLKGVSPTLLHKSESGMVKLNIGSEEQVRKAYGEITEAGMELDGVLVQEMVKGNRELVMGLLRDPSFGPCVMFGLGGIFTEVLKDVTFRIAPFDHQDALEMIGELKAGQILDEFRGNPAIDRDHLAEILVAMGNLGLNFPEIEEVDVNPLIVTGNRVVAVDALVVLSS